MKAPDKLTPAQRRTERELNKWAKELSKALIEADILGARAAAERRRREREEQMRWLKLPQQTTPVKRTKTKRTGQPKLF